MLDEWQLLPVLWDSVANEADAAHGSPGLFMLTGSATPTPKGEAERKHTGTGRIARITMGTMGFLFESLCVRDLRAYLSPLGGEVFHYRDKSGLEADAILRLKSGAWAGVEVKLGGEERIEEGARHLLAIAAKVDPEKTPAPSFLMVITAGRYAYTRKDGVHVVPLACLGA